MYGSVSKAINTSKSFLRRFYNLTTMISIPALALICVLGYGYVSQQKADLLDLASRWSLDASAGIDAALQSATTTIDILASSSELRSGNLEGFYNNTKKLHLSEGGWITVRNREGEIMMATSLDHFGKTGLYYHDAKVDHAVFDLGQDVVSDLRSAKTKTGQIIFIASPVFDEAGKIIYSLQYVIPAEHFLKLLNDTSVPNGWYLTLIDNNYKFVSRSRDNEKFVGTPGNPLFFDAVNNMLPGGTETYDDKIALDGKHIIGAIHKMKSTGWTVGVSAQSSVYGQPVWYAIGYGVVFVGLIMGVSYGTSAVFGRRLKRVTIEASVHEQQLKATQKELHHRVKNSIQNVASLLRLQTSATSDNMAKDALDKAAQRINTIGRVQQGLYDTDELVIDSSYLHNILADISAKMPVSIKTVISQAKLDLDLGNPLGLMLNEAVTNAYRYGKTSATGPVPVEVTFLLEHDDRWSLTVRDFGPGFKPDEPSRRGKGLGVRYMYALEKQLSGVLTFSNHPEGGGVVTVTGPLRVEKVSSRIEL